MAMFADKLVSAHTWLALGADLIPKQPRSKDNIAGFGPRQRRIKTAPEVELWFGERRANLAIVLDHGFVAADFDDAGAYWTWAAGPGANVETYTELTARGAHVVWRGDALPAGNAPGVEFKNAGVLMVAPSVHPSGAVYRILCSLPPARLTFKQAQTLFPFLSSTPKPAAVQDISTEILRRRPAAALSSRPTMIEIIKSKVSVIDELNAAGVKAWKSGGSAVVASCPWHGEDKHPSLWAMPERGLFGCNVPSCIAYGKHDVINARALRRGLTVPEAIRELWAEVR